MRAGGDPAEHLLRLPTGTTLRFLVLLLLALATAALAHSTASPPAARFADEITRCEILNAPPASTGLDGYATYAEAAVADAGFRECVRPITLRISGYVATGVGSLLLLATALYWLRPVWIIWRRRLVPLPGAPEFDVIRAELADLTARSGLGRRPPVFLIDPFHGRRTGFVFGRGRRPLVCLSGGLLALHGRDRAAFRAIVRHELAHVRNRDVAITGWTIAVWRAFLVTAALPFAVALSGIEVSEDLTVGRPSLDRLADPDVWWISLRLALLAALVYLSRNAILRARELEADLRAGPEGMTVHSGATRDPWWRRWISHHPPASVRRRVVEDPVWWARPRFGALAATGVVIGLVVGHGDQATWILITTRARLVDTLPRIVVSALLAGALGLVVWQAALFARRGRGRLVAHVLPGTALAVGVVLGREAELNRDPFVLSSATALVGSAVFVVVVAAVGAWMVCCARNWLREDGGVHPVAVVVVTAAGALVLYCWASWMFLRGWPTLFGLTNWMDRQTIASSGAVFGSVETIAALMTDSALANVQSKSALAQASVVVLWLLPLLGARIPRRRSARVGLLVGGVSGLVGFVLTVILRMFPPTASSAVSPEAVRSAWWAFLLAFAVLAQVVAAALAGRSAPSTALMAAYATIAPALVLIVLSVTVCGCLPGDGLPDAVCLRPPGWLFLAAHLGLLAIAVPMTGTLGALLGMALRAVRQPSITPEQEQNRTRHRAALPLLAGTLAMAAGVASAKHLDAEDNAPPAVMTQPTPTTKLPRPSSPFEAAYFVAVWYTGGGKTHMDQVRNTVRAFISSPSENTCSAMGTATRQAMAFARAPDDTAQRTWHAALQAANRAGGQCGTGRWNDAAGSALTADEHLDQLVLDLARALTIPK